MANRPDVSGRELSLLEALERIDAALSVPDPDPDEDDKGFLSSKPAVTQAASEAAQTDKIPDDDNLRYDPQEGTDGWTIVDRRTHAVADVHGFVLDHLTARRARSLADVLNRLASVGRAPPAKGVAF